MKKLLAFVLLAACGSPPQTDQISERDAYRAAHPHSEVAVVESAQLSWLPPLCNNNNVCAAPETIGNCPHDCTPWCNFNLVCGLGRNGSTETHAGCPNDCPPQCPWLNSCDGNQAPLHAYCSKEVAAVIAADPYCGTTWWDGWCVQEVWTFAGRNTCGGGPSAPGVCTFPLFFIAAGGITSCGPATEVVCAQRPSCCVPYAQGGSWDVTCGTIASTLPGGWALPGNTACGDDACTAGETPNNCTDCYR